jgi:hypothetical protein
MGISITTRRTKCIHGERIIEYNERTATKTTTVASDFIFGIPVSFNNNVYHHVVIEIFLKMLLGITEHNRENERTATKTTTVQI